MGAEDSHLLMIPGTRSTPGLSQPWVWVTEKIRGVNERWSLGPDGQSTALGRTQQVAAEPPIRKDSLVQK